MADFDLAIIGGGINGCGIARDAAGRGLRVLLVEQNDFASGTSSASTKLIHGGLRYLEHGAFRLVREALSERETLLRIAPHVIRPMRFVLPPSENGRPAWMLRAGLFLYDHLGRHKVLPKTETLDLTHHVVGIPLSRRYNVAFEYSDCWVDDARLVVLNAMDAAARGAVIRTRARCVFTERHDEWTIVLNIGGHREATSARALVNATGAWAGSFAETVLRIPSKAPVRLVKGSHIVVPRLFDHDRGYLLQNTDGRVFFALPYERDLTLIGTTDVDFKGDPAAVGPSGEEIQYLCRAANQYFRQPTSPEQVVWAYAGVRALYGGVEGKPEDVTRDYHLALDGGRGKAPVLTVYGGKITTYRRLAEVALARLGKFIGRTEPWTAKEALPGGDFAFNDVAALAERSRQTWPFLSEQQALRLVRAYGTRIERILGTAGGADDLGERFGADLTAVEVRYLMAHEWALTAEDVLWRRSKLGLRLSPAETDTLSRFMAQARL